MASRNINFHPTGYHPASLTKTTFDVIIIGGGPVTSFTEMRLAKAGLSVAVIESELYGGECHFFGCIPSKALLRPVEAGGPHNPPQTPSLLYPYYEVSVHT